jgi:lysophospholipase L1-like esterase
MSGTKNAPPVDPEVGLLDVEESAGAEIVLAGEGDDRPYAPGTFRKIGTGMATLVALIVLTYVVPGLEFARPWTTEDPVPFWNIIGREILGDEAGGQQEQQQVSQAQALARAAAAENEDAPIPDRPVLAAPGPDEGADIPGYQPHPDDALEVPQSLELPEPDALDPFFEHLAQTEAGYEGAVTRVTHWGDSVIGNDHVSATLRAKMQRRFGDAGHGFHLLAKNNPSYRHKGIRFSGGDDWGTCYIIMGCKKDGRYGLGATTVWGSKGARSKFSTAEKTANGRKVSRFELWYAGKPGGGDFEIRVDKDEPVVVETAADELEDRWHTVELTDDAHTITVGVKRGSVRGYGVVLERDVPGVVWDGMSQVGAFTDRMLAFDAEHLRAQIDHRGSDLLVFQFGGNDLTLKPGKRKWFEEQYVEVLRTFRGTEHPRACLVIAPVDHGQRKGGRIVSDEAMSWLVPTMRRLALQEGCAFFDTWAAMGGQDSIARWRNATPPLMSADLAHLTSAGEQALGQMIYLALMEAYRDYRARVAK